MVLFNGQKVCLPSILARILDKLYLHQQKIWTTIFWYSSSFGLCFIHVLENFRKVSTAKNCLVHAILISICAFHCLFSFQKRDCPLCEKSFTVEEFSSHRKQCARHNKKYLERLTSAENYLCMICNSNLVIWPKDIHPKSFTCNAYDPPCTIKSGTVNIQNIPFSSFLNCNIYPQEQKLKTMGLIFICALPAISQFVRCA